MSTKRELFDYLETELGERPNKKEVKRTQREIAKVESGIFQKQVKPNFANSFLFKHALTSIVAVMLCLSIVLPITLQGRDNQFTPITPEPFIYTDNIILISIEEQGLRRIPDLLFFSQQQLTLAGVIPMWGVSRMELADDAPLVLSYVVVGSVLTLGSDMFAVEYRIRTHMHYHFAWYHENSYSALEIARTRYANLVTEQNIQEFNISEEQIVDDVTLPRTSNVHGFMVDGITIFTHASYSFDENFNEVRNVLIHFTFGGNDYFVRITEIFGAQVSTSLEDLVGLAKSTIVPALFENIDN